MSGNQIKSIKIQTAKESANEIDESTAIPKKPFENLRVLLLMENKIDNWESIDQLDCMHNLQDLRLQLNPLTDGIYQIIEFLKCF